MKEMKRLPCDIHTGVLLSGAYAMGKIAYAISRYRNDTIWPRVQAASGLNVVALVPAVIFSATAHWTAAA